ncbi:hypothetical protein Ahy_A03g012244 [Arachis hypogaea]|uniref:Endonuclease/exonuclease/phosphatase domain-containing protein n=1 Tax=Arachis hypogaea TaxID=3818 RepID=A0A445DT15_ARAHY|nr:hypothetical protein Ahy_A03g012244 [Arachis hypogaea]
MEDVVAHSLSDGHGVACPGSILDGAYESQVGASPYWFLTAIYGSLQRINWNYLWDDIRSIYNDINLPWCLIGDFNALLHEHECHSRSNSNNRIACPDFQNCVSDCGLYDLGYSGWPFTWNRENLVDRLDCGLSNLD